MFRIRNEPDEVIKDVFAYGFEVILYK